MTIFAPPFIKNLFLLPAIIAGLSVIPAGQVTAQTFTRLHSFGGSGANPNAGLILSGNTLYGTAGTGGRLSGGTVFKINTNGTSFTTLHEFSTYGIDGRYPGAGLILSDNTLYGITEAGGADDAGTLFKVKTNGSGFTNLYRFSSGSGGNPFGGLIILGDTLFGTTGYGGLGVGTVFKLITNGVGFTRLHNFKRVSDGANPFGGLVVSGNTLYGTAYRGGSFSNGTVFAVNIDGSGFTNLHSFSALSNSTNSDGAYPYAGLILSGSTLYGTAQLGGSSGNGTVFALNTDGSGFTNLHSFTALSGALSTNSDGAKPYAGFLALSGNTLYGTAGEGGSFGKGTVFSVNTDGADFTTLHSFTGSGGAYPNAGLILAGNTLYGTTGNGGNLNSGTVFSLSLPPQLTIIRSEANIIFKWPTNAAGFTLQSTTNLVSPAIWMTNSPAPTVVNGQNTVTNSISGTQKFFRLSQ